MARFQSQTQHMLLQLATCFFATLPMMWCCGCQKDQPTVRRSLATVTKNIVVVGGRSDEKSWQSFLTGRQVANSILIGLDADMTSGSARAGEAIRRGVAIAIKEINSAGGLLGRPLELIIRDHRSNPARGIENIGEFGGMSDMLAIVGGKQTPVVMRELEAIHQHEMIYLVPWAAGTPIVSNGYSPNYIFRVSIRDEYAAGVMVEAAQKRGLSMLGVMLERTAWGRSNEVAIRAALDKQALRSLNVEWFNVGETEMDEKIDRLAAERADAILMVCNTLEGAAIVNAMALRPETDRLPILSHWGIAGGEFTKLIGERMEKVDLTFLQTYSFIDPPYPERSKTLYDTYAASFEDCQSPRDIFSPTGTAHAYEITMMLAAAVKRAGTIDRPTVREALEADVPYQGIVRDYKHPFPAQHHDALDAGDFRMARFGVDGVIEPLPPDTKNGRE